MKRFIQVSGIVAVIFVGTFVSNCLIGSALGGSVDCISGDVTGDGTANFVDAIYLLNWLFQDGDDPVACAQEVPDFMTKEDYIAARNQFEPRGVDRVFVEAEPDRDEEITLVEIPEGKIFIVTYFTGINVRFTPTLLTYGTSSNTLVVDVEPVVYPITTDLIVEGTNDVTYTAVWGYFLDAPDEE